MKIAIIGTVASSILGFRANLIKALLEQQHSVYAFVSEYSQNELNNIAALGAIPITYELNRGGVNPLADAKATYVLSRKINPDKTVCKT